jgi:UDP-glucuronate 4-epimerase
MILVTGAAGFIGSYVCRALLERGAAVLGVDDLNAYYSPALKRARLATLEGAKGFRFVELDIADHEALFGLAEHDQVETVVHLAAQAGVRYSLENPFAYAHSNLAGHLSVLEFCRHAKRFERLVYASSSSVYGLDSTPPFREDERADAPISLYAATKRADELMSATYAHLYKIPQIGLRFFTVYGPWGRPDMAYWTFTQKILAGEPIQVFNNGDLRRDFTYIDDIVTGVIATVTEPMRLDPARPHRVYNIGNNRPVELLRFIEVLEQAIGREAIKDFKPMQPGDVYETCADIEAIRGDYGFEPKTPLEVGLPRFVDWFINNRQAVKV